MVNYFSLELKKQGSKRNHFLWKKTIGIYCHFTVWTEMGTRELPAFSVLVASQHCLPKGDCRHHGNLVHHPPGRLGGGTCLPSQAHTGPSVHPVPSPEMTIFLLPVKTLRAPPNPCSSTGTSP